MRDHSETISSLLSSTTFADSLQCPTPEIKSLLNKRETASILISMISQTEEMNLARKIHLLITTSDSSILENIANDHETLHTLFQEIFDQSSSNISTRFFIKILSSNFFIIPF
jgi:hypothetical protein